MMPVIVQNILHRIKTRTPPSPEKSQKRKDRADKSSSILLFFLLISCLLLYVFS